MVSIHRLSIFLVIIFLTSCVGKKKHLEALQKIESSYQAELQETSTLLNRQLQATRDSNLQMRLQLAERKGENNALVAMQDKLENRIESLKQDLENQGIKSQSNTQSLSQQLQQKDQEISRLERLLVKVDSELEKNLKTLGSLANDVRTSFAILPSDLYEITTSNLAVKVIVSEDLLFKPKTTTSIATTASQVLGGIASSLEKYPSMNVVVLGHTDNKPPRNKGYKDNWTVSAVRAAILSRMLANDHGLSTNQVMAAGKGEFAPKASNETREGQKQNRRIEFVLQPRQEDLIRVVKKITAEK